MISHFEVVAGQPNPARKRAIKSNIIDRFAYFLSPSWAMKRQIARQRMERLGDLQQNYRGFEAIDGGRSRYGMSYTSSDTNSFISDGSESLRQHVRYMEFQTGFVSGPISRLVNNIVGSGFHFQSRIKADNLPLTDQAAAALNTQIEGFTKKWFKQADKRLIQRYSWMTRQVEGALVRDGEVLVIGRKSGRRDRLIPYCQDIYEIDRLSTPAEELTNPNIQNGIEYDSEGVPKSYFVLKRHPGNTLGTYAYRADDYEQVDAFWPNGAKKVMHLYSPIRPEQLRGFSAFASALKDYQDLDRYREAEILAALEDACLVGIIKSANPTAWQQGMTAQTTLTDSQGRPVHEFAPNKWYYAQNADEINIHGPKRPNDGLTDFINQILSGPANALDIPPEVLSQNWQGMNYSNARTVLLQFYLVCRIAQRFLIDYYCEPTYECVLNDLVAFGHIRANAYSMRKEEYLAHAWIPPGWQWVDPLKEAQANIQELEGGTESLPRIWAQKGEDWEEQLESQARVLQKKQELEAKYGVQFPKKDGGTQPAADNQDEPEQPRQLRAIK